MSTSETPDTSATEHFETVRPTSAPIAMAMGVAMTCWGLMAMSLNIKALWFMTAAGIGVAAWALKIWIREIVLNWESTR